MESLSNSPFYMSRGATPYGGLKLVDACHYDGLTDAHTSIWILYTNTCFDINEAKFFLSFFFFENGLYDKSAVPALQEIHEVLKVR